MGEAVPRRMDADDGRERAQLVESVIAHGFFDVVYQPIIDLEASTVAGSEVLTRPRPDSGFSNPLELFGAAAEFGLLVDLENVIRDRVITEAPSWLADGLLFINNSPDVFTTDGFIESLLASIDQSPHLTPRQIVLEVTEQSTGHSLDDLGERARSLRALGFQIAIDDVGAGVSGLNQITNVRPDWIKLDRELIVDIDRDPFKQNLIRFFVRFTRFGGMSLIAEGIERHEELGALIELGVRFAQGYCLGRPAPGRTDLTDDVVASIRSLQTSHHEHRLINSGAMHLSDLAEPVAQVDQSDTVSDAWDRVSLQLHASGAAVCDRRRFRGWISRDELAAHAASAQCVGDLPIIEAGRVSDDTTLAEALEVVAQLDGAAQSAPLIVQSKGSIVGAVSLRRLLQAAARVQRRSSSLVRPLSGLPGRMQADRWLAGAIDVRRSTDLAFIDIRNFGAYNASYGTDLGDAMIRQFGELLQDIVTDSEETDAFVAYLGEDRFMIARSAELEAALQTFIRKFERVLAEVHTSDDRERGTFSFFGSDGAEEQRSLVRPRVVYLRRPFVGESAIRTPYEVYQRVRSLRMSAEERMVVYERRQGGAAHRASA